MKISYRWLLNYLPVAESPEKIGEILTSIGLEVEGISPLEGAAEKFRGLVVGEVLEVWQHPGADRLRLTKVNIGDASADPLQIVCGAPNVAQGQKVVVATVGTTLYPLGADSFKISKSKIRGEVSMGMLCAEDEIGIGKSHDGIIVLSPDVTPGTAYSDLLGAEQDYVFEIGLTPNRADAFSHIGVARDLAAAVKNMAGLNLNRNIQLQWPDLSAYPKVESDAGFSVEVDNSLLCPRYCGVVITGIKVAPSPEWLQNKLKAIGLNPINNVVDITNFVQHELGQPLHAFDANVIQGKKVIVKTLNADTPFVTLDGIERKLHAEDLMICNNTEPMCIAGVFGGLASGVNDGTNSIFLESAFFNAVSVRKTARRHGLNTDASFRFERGVDPNITVSGLKRAALLIVELCGGQIASKIFDTNPSGSEDFEVEFNLQRCTTLLGLEIPVESIKSILSDLDIKIIKSEGHKWLLAVPPYRVDVRREADVVEEILRIYGFHNIPIPPKLNASLSYAPAPDVEKLRNRISDMLAARGFVEMISNSLGKSVYADLLDQSEAYAGDNVPILNPLSQELGMMRQSLVFGGLEAILRNINFKQFDLRLFEFGKIYGKKDNGYQEHMHLALFVSGNQNEENWNQVQKKSNFAQLFGEVDQIIKKFRIKQRPGLVPSESKLFADGLRMVVNNKTLAEIGKLDSVLLKKFDIKQDVWYADIFWENLLSLIPSDHIQYQEPEKFPVVRRDLSLVLERGIKYSELAESAFKSEKKLLKEVGLFDVYEGEKLGSGKKSYALSFLLNDTEKTLTDERIEQSMSKILQGFQKEFGAELRS